MLANSEEMEDVGCYYCGSSCAEHFTDAWEDLTGKPGTFRFVKCSTCDLVYQNPRVAIDHIRRYYDDEYIAHRGKTDWGIITQLYNWEMEGYDRRKTALVARYVDPVSTHDVLDVGCGAGTFLTHWRRKYGSRVTGVDFVDLSHLSSFREVDFRCGLFYEQDLDESAYDVVTMWHFLEHDYDPLQTLHTAARVIRPGGRVIIEVPRLDSVSYRLFRERWPGLQAPQHTVLYDRMTLIAMAEKAGLRVLSHLPYGAFPPYFYLFAGVAFKILKGKGLNLSKAIYPYFLGQFLLSPILLFSRYLNLAMQTVVCERKT